MLLLLSQSPNLKSPLIFFSDSVFRVQRPNRPIDHRLRYYSSSSSHFFQVRDLIFVVSFIKVDETSLSETWGSPCFLLNSLLSSSLSLSIHYYSIKIKKSILLTFPFILYYFLFVFRIIVAGKGKLKISVVHSS